MKLRLALACSLLLLAAIPSYAIPCSTCVDDQCEGSPGSATRCLPVINGCETRSNPNCSGFTGDAAPPAVLAEWTVSSIEVSHPAESAAVVTAPAAAARAAVPPATLQK